MMLLYLLWYEEQKQEDNRDKVVESGQEASDNALVDGVGYFHGHFEKYRDAGK